MDPDPFLEISSIKAQGRKIFGHEISLTLCGDLYATVDLGRLFIWNPEDNGFQLLLSVPRPDGTIDLVTTPEVIEEFSDSRLVALSADRIFRDWCQWPAESFKTGERAEDLFLDVCLKLGFQAALEVDYSQPYTVRRASTQEDWRDKIDFVLTFPVASHELDRLTVPLQLTTCHKMGDDTKRQKVTDGAFAYLPLDLFAGRGLELLERAAGNEAYALWLCGEIIKIVCQRYLRQPLALPAGPPFLEAYLSAPTLKVLGPRLKRGVRINVNQLLEQQGVTPRQARTNAFAYLVHYIQFWKTPYDMRPGHTRRRGW